MNTFYRKGHNGQQGTTNIELVGTPFTVAINTRKGNNGTLYTSVTAHQVDGHFQSHRVFQDYSQTLQQVKARCTAKAVETLHEAAIANADNIVAEVKAYYTSEEYVSKYGADFELA